MAKTANRAFSISLSECPISCSFSTQKKRKSTVLLKIKSKTCYYLAAKHFRTAKYEKTLDKIMRVCNIDSKPAAP